MGYKLSTVNDSFIIKDGNEVIKTIQNPLLMRDLIHGTWTLDKSKPPVRTPGTYIEVHPSRIQNYNPITKEYINATGATLHASRYFIKTLPEITAEYRKWSDMWEHSNEFNILTQNLSSFQQDQKANKKMGITNVVGLGTGSLIGYPIIAMPGETFMNASNALQVAVLHSIAHTLRAVDNTNLPVIAQDPIYSTQISGFLTKELGFHIVNDPDAFALIDRNSLVLHINTGPHIVHWVERAEWPAAMITEDWINGTRSSFFKNFPKEWRAQAARMFAQYDKINIGGYMDWNAKGRKPWMANEVFLWIRKPLPPRIVPPALPQSSSSEEPEGQSENEMD